jgi:DNA-binding transcriptional MerR regulator
MNSAEACHRSGASYRQLDYWTRQGHLHPVGGVGSGQGRDWSRSEVEVAERMVPLVEAGFSPKLAERIARMHEGEHIYLYDNIRLMVEER